MLSCTASQVIQSFLTLMLVLVSGSRGSPGFVTVFERSSLCSEVTVNILFLYQFPEIFPVLPLSTEIH